MQRPKFIRKSFAILLISAYQPSMVLHINFIFYKQSLNSRKDIYKKTLTKC